VPNTPQFTQPQLLAILCLMRYEDWTFRVFAKRRAIARHGGLRDIQSHFPEAHQTHFGHSQQQVSPELIAA